MDQTYQFVYEHETATDAKEAIRREYRINGESWQEKPCKKCEVKSTTGRFFNPVKPGLAFWVCSEGHVSSTSPTHNYRPAPEDTRPVFLRDKDS